jgi:SAM-dependent methyltransferase
VDQEFILRAVADEVRHQKELTLAEKYQLGKQLEAVLATPAGRPSRRAVASCHPFGKGKTRDKVASVLRLSARQWDKLKAVYESPHGDLKQELEKHGKVDRAFRDLERRRRVEEVQRQNQGKDFQNVICADCRDLLPTFAADTFDAVITDPVFGIGFEYGDGQEQSRTPEDYWDWLRPVYRQILRVTKPGGLIAIWQAEKYLRYAWRWFGDDIHVYIAAKDHVQIRPGAPFTHAYDPVILRWKPGAKPLLPMRQDRSKDYFVSHMRFDSLAACHPCPRPLDLCECLVRSFTIENGLILDCFAGAGTIPLAVQRVGGGRRYVAVEKNPAYCQLIEQRLAEVGGDP